jgi:hypothetical protein
VSAALRLDVLRRSACGCCTMFSLCYVVVCGKTMSLLVGEHM